jgi:hypothetical protein
MAAGGLSYSGLTNYGKTTLPSVDSWGTNMNILRDPPKAIMTRRIDKVGETSSLTQMVDDSGDRACEAIKVFARGVNPSVSVSYNNYGNGNRSGNLAGLTPTLSTVGSQAKLPYTIMKDGAFRPPVRTAQDLMPLSRQPRAWTTAFTKPGFTDFSRKMRTSLPASKLREVKSERLQACVAPTATYKIAKPLEKPYEVKNVIQPSLKTSASSGTRTLDRTQQHVKTPTKEVEQNPLHARANAIPIDPTRYVNTTDFDTTPYIQECLSADMHSNMSSATNRSTNITDILDLGDLPIKDIRTTSHSAGIQGTDRTKYIHENLELDRTLPSYQTRTNKADSRIYVRSQPQNSLELERNMPRGQFTTNVVARGEEELSSRDVRLNPKINPGGFSGGASKPSLSRPGQMEQFETQKASLSRMAAATAEGRFSKPAPWAQ